MSVSECESARGASQAVCCMSMASRMQHCIAHPSRWVWVRTTLVCCAAHQVRAVCALTLPMQRHKKQARKLCLGAFQHHKINNNLKILSFTVNCTSISFGVYNISLSLGSTLTSSVLTCRSLKLHLALHQPVLAYSKG